MGRPYGIFCLEGIWEADLRKQVSVLPTLELLKTVGEIDFIHRHAGTVASLVDLLHRWNEGCYEDYDMLYLAYHGDAGKVFVEQEAIHLTDLAVEVGDTLSGSIVYFGSCGVLQDDRAAGEFLRLTHASWLLGYTKRVDWFESSAFDLLMFPILSKLRRIGHLRQRMHKHYGSLTDRLGFTMMKQS